MSMSAQAMLEKAKSEIPNLSPGDVFIVKDLFKGYEWSKEKITTRLTLGTLFLNYVKENSASIEIMEKTSSGQQKYKKL